MEGGGGGAKGEREVNVERVVEDMMVGVDGCMDGELKENSRKMSGRNNEQMSLFTSESTSVHRARIPSHL